MVGKNRFQTTFAFTLAEILIVVIIIGALASIVMPQFYTVIERSRSAEGVNVLENVLNSERRWAADNDNTFTNNMGDLDISFDNGFGNFNAPTFASPLPSPSQNLILVNIQRNAASPFNYTLSITATGTVSCSGGGASVCSKMGY